MYIKYVKESVTEELLK